MSTVLITGSDNPRRTQYAAWLQSFGYEVYETDTYDDAYHALANASLPHPPNVLIIDVKLSAPQARILIDTVRHTLHLTNMSIIVIGGDHQLGDDGIDAFLQRPVEPFALVESVRCACVPA